MGRDDQPTDELDTQGAGRATGLADPTLIASGRRLGERYRLERRLGHGGMATVWLAIDERLDRPVAVKVLSDNFATDSEFLARFRREAHVAAGLQHPNLVGVYDFDAGRRPYLVMEYISGGDLATRVEAGDLPDAEDLALELLSALRHIHAAGVLHRDLKPQNVLIDGGGHARLADFGIAQPRDATSLTRTGQVIGTERFIAPEVLRGGPATERSDLFGLGVVLAEVARHGAGAAFWELTERLRDPEPARRPHSAAAALATLERRATPVPGSPTQPFGTAPGPPAPTDPLPPRRFEPTPTGLRDAKRRRTAIGVLAVLVVAVGVAIALALGSGGGDPEVDVREQGEGGAGGADREATGESAEPETATAAPPDASAAEQTAEEPPPDSDDSSGAPPASDGAVLNDEGFALNQDGNYEDAVPVLEDAVAALEGGDETTYNYALYNLGVAYLGAGEPAKAIPVLEERLGFDDGQLGEVQATLDEAYEAAGRDPPDEKPGNGPKDKLPPPFEED